MTLTVLPGTDASITPGMSSAAAVPVSKDRQLELRSQEVRSLTIGTRLPSGPLSGIGEPGSAILKGERICVLQLPLPSESSNLRVGQEILNALLKGLGRSAADKALLARIRILHQLTSEEASEFFSRRAYVRLANIQHADPRGNAAAVLRTPRLQTNAKTFLPKPVALFFEQGSPSIYFGYESGEDAATRFVEELLASFREF